MDIQEIISFFKFDTILADLEGILPTIDFDITKYLNLDAVTEFIGNLFAD